MKALLASCLRKQVGREQSGVRNGLDLENPHQDLSSDCDPGQVCCSVITDAVLCQPRFPSRLGLSTYV